MFQKNPNRRKKSTPVWCEKFRIWILDSSIFFSNLWSSEKKLEHFFSRKNSKGLKRFFPFFFLRKYRNHLFYKERDLLLNENNDLNKKKCSFIFREKNIKTIFWSFISKCSYLFFHGKNFRNYFYSIFVKNWVFLSNLMFLVGKTFFWKQENIKMKRMNFYSFSMQYFLL